VIDEAGMAGTPDLAKAIGYVIDRGGSIKGNRLDVFFPTHQQAVDWGRRWVQVSIEP